MKLVRLMSGVLAATAVALACGCSTSPAPAPRTAQNSASQVDPNLSGTTNLMSAELAGPAPKVGVGTAHLTNDDQLDAPKEVRRSDGSRRGGGFGSSK
jgi:hypothetical protein